MKRKLAVFLISLVTCWIGVTQSVRADNGGAINFDVVATTVQPLEKLSEPSPEKSPEASPEHSSEPSTDPTSEPSPQTPPAQPAIAQIQASAQNLSFDPNTHAVMATAQQTEGQATPEESAPGAIAPSPEDSASHAEAPGENQTQIAMAQIPTDQLFAQGSESLVARTVGHAEGTRTAEGDRTAAYVGHVDPGNGVWNLGSFSFQHCPEAAYQCTTPEQADVHQLRRLERQDAELQARAEALNVSLNLEERLNGIDLANQAPAAALARPGYVEWLKQARAKGLRQTTAILQARVLSYWNPVRQRWDAPGLGNTEGSITHDQNRRMTAIARALRHYIQER